MAKRFGRRMPVISGASSDASWAPSRRAGPRRSAVMSSNAMIAAQRASLTTPVATAIVPKCQGLARAQWLADRQAELLPVPYFHVVFTLPAPVGEIAFQNKAAVYAILFRAAAETLDHHRRRSQASRRPARQSPWSSTPGARPCSTIRTSIASCRAAALARRHTLDRLPPRLLPAGARPLAAVPPVVPARPAECLRRRQAALLRQTRGPCRSRRPSPVVSSELRRINWVVYAKPPFGGPEQVLAYLGRYTHRVAIANSRLISLSDGKVRFTWKDYRQDGKTKVMTLDADEFIRRFLLHALPDGFHRIRHYGFLANGGRGDNLALCRRLLAIDNASAWPNRRMIPPKAIAHSPQSTSPSVPIAAAPCSGSQPCRAAANPQPFHCDTS